jgi:hypothetical protein
MLDLLYASTLTVISFPSKWVPYTISSLGCRAGIQAQTAECLVVGEAVTQHMVVVLNKVGRGQPSQ